MELHSPMKTRTVVAYGLAGLLMIPNLLVFIIAVIGLFEGSGSAQSNIARGYFAYYVVLFCGMPFLVSFVLGILAKRLCVYLRFGLIALPLLNMFLVFIG